MVVEEGVVDHAKDQGALVYQAQRDTGIGESVHVLSFASAAARGGAGAMWLACWWVGPVEVGVDSVIGVRG